MSLRKNLQIKIKQQALWKLSAVLIDAWVPKGPYSSTTFDQGFSPIHWSNYWLNHPLYFSKGWLENPWSKVLLEYGFFRTQACAVLYAHKKFNHIFFLQVYTLRVDLNSFKWSIRIHTINNNQILSGEHLKILGMRVKMLPSNKIVYFRPFCDFPSVTETNIASKNNCLFFISLSFV